MRYFLVVLFFLISFNSVSQRISIRQDSISFEKIIDQLELQTAFRFYYSPSWVTDINLSVNVEKEPIHSFLQWLCNASRLSYFALDEKRIIFLKDYQIKTNYAEIYTSFLDRQQKLIKDTIEYQIPRQPDSGESTINKEYQLYTLGSQSINPHLDLATISGHIKDIDSGEPLVNTVIYFEDLKDGTVTNTYGYYSFAIPKGRYKVEFRSVGMKTTYRNIIIHSGGIMDVEMKTKPTSLKEVVITAQSEDPVRNLRMGMEKITMKTLKQLPLGMGEADVIKSTLLLPGVQSVGEASGGFNVRGGGTDQNLILLNEAPINNTSHFFGFFSGFNSDVIKDITLYKSGIPAKFGGRVSSVMDLTLKDGNRKVLKAYGGISPVSGRVVIEGPIKKDKCSFIIGGRSTYSDWVLKLLDDNKLEQSKAGFYDFQGNLSYDLNQNNSFYLSGYYSHDNFDYYSEDAFEYNTMASTLKWKHVFSPKLFSLFSGVVSTYDNTLDSRVDSSSLHSVEYKLHQYSFKSDFSYRSNLNHRIDFGVHATWYNLSPGIRKPISDQSVIASKQLENERALETALYFSDEFELTHFMSLSVGLRYSLYSNFGPKTQYEYRSGMPRSVESVIDTTQYQSGESVVLYSGPEIRISSNVRLSGTSSLKIGYNRMYQYIQMISNTASMMPTDIWKLSDNYIKPQRGDQFSIGFYKKLRQGKIETSIETYYKKLHNILDYKGGAELIMNDHLETDILNGDGKAYGVELMLQKKTGK